MAFPTSIESAEYFGVAYNGLSTYLTKEASASDTTIYVASTDNFPSSGWITIEDEVIYYTGKTSGSFTGCTRGADNTVAAIHQSSKTVSLTYTAAMHNRIVTELIATQTKLGDNNTFLVTPSRAPTSNYQVANKKYVDDCIANKGFWIDVPGTPTRVSDTQFTITDTNNDNKYDKLFSKGTIIKWLEGSTFQWAMVYSSSYASNTVTVNILGDTLTDGFSSMKYAISKAMMETFIIPGTLAIGTDLAKTFYAPYNICAFSIDVYVKTAGTTNATTFDVNDDGTTIITTKPSIASGATSDINNVVDNVETVIAQGSLITIDIDAVSTTPPVEAYIYLFYVPEAWRYIV